MCGFCHVNASIIVMSMMECNNVVVAEASSAKLPNNNQTACLYNIVYSVDAEQIVSALACCFIMTREASVLFAAIA